MADLRIVLCDAPCLTEAMDIQALKTALEGNGEIISIPYVCSQHGLKKAAEFLEEIGNQGRGPCLVPP